MMHSAVEPQEPEMDDMAWGFLRSPYANDWFAEWPIDQRLHAYLENCGLTEVADDGTISDALLNRVMTNIASALATGPLKPGGIGRENHPQEAC
jgi:hypothetical protein